MDNKSLRLGESCQIAVHNTVFVVSDCEQVNDVLPFFQTLHLYGGVSVYLAIFVLFMKGDCRGSKPISGNLPESTLTKKGGATLDPKKAKTAVGAAAAFKKRNSLSLKNESTANRIG